MRHNSVTTMRLAALIVSASLVAVVASQPSIDSISRCHSLPLAQMDFDAMIRMSPFSVLRSTSKALNCTKAIYGPPQCGSSTSTGSAYAIQRDCSYYESVQLIDGNKQFISTSSITNSPVRYRVIFAKFDATRSAFCFVNCAPDDIKYESVTCLGKTETDEADIQTFLDTKFKGVPGIMNTKQGCLSN